MNTFGDVKSTVRAVVGDPMKEWATDAYLAPLVNSAYRLQTLYIKRGSSRELEASISIPDTADGNGNSTSQGRTSLAPLQAPGQPLAGLYDPLHLWWKPAGTPDNYYREAETKHPLPFTGPGAAGAGLGSGRMYWDWMGSQLLVTPMNFAVDLQVDGRFNPPPLTKDSDVLVVHPDMETTVSYATLALVGVEAGNPGWQQAGVGQAEASADDIVTQIIKARQGNTARAGRISRRGCGWYWR